MVENPSVGFGQALLFSVIFSPLTLLPVLYEVGVDAQTGKVLENLKEGPNPA